MDGQEGAHGEQLLSVDTDEGAITDYECIESDRSYREWFAPAEILNSQGPVAPVIESSWEPSPGASGSEDAARPIHPSGAVLHASNAKFDGYLLYLADPHSPQLFVADDGTYWTWIIEAEQLLNYRVGHIVAAGEISAEVQSLIVDCKSLLEPDDVD